VWCNESAHLCLNSFLTPHIIVLKTPAPVFVLLYVPCQFATITFLSLTMGMVKGNNSMFDESTFLGDLLFRPGNGIHIALVLASGFFNANGDFLCASACSKLPGSVANLIYGGWGLIQGTLLTFLVEKYDGNLAFLFCGIFTAMLGVLSMSASDYFSVDPSTVISRASIDYGSPHIDVSFITIAGDNRQPDLKTALLEETEINASASMNADRKYIYLCLLAGVMTGVFAPLSVLASEGDGAVDNPYVLMFLFQCGQLSAIPFLMFYYSKFFTTGAKHDTHGKIWQYVEALLELPQPDFKYGCCAGVAVGLGFFLFFSAADVLPSTITFGISNCAPLVTISVDVFVFGHLDNATLWQTRFMIISTTLFASAIVQMVLAQSI
jgi:hypothetical protein